MLIVTFHVICNVLIQIQLMYESQNASGLEAKAHFMKVYLHKSHTSSSKSTPSPDAATNIHRKATIFPNARTSSGCLLNVKNVYRFVRGVLWRSHSRQKGGSHERFRHRDFGMQETTWCFCLFYLHFFWPI